jgi:elongation factor G
LKIRKLRLPLTAPIKEGEKVVGIIDIIAKKAYDIDGSKRKEIRFQRVWFHAWTSFISRLSESVAETSEALMEKFFEGEEFTVDEINGALGAE